MSVLRVELPTTETVKVYLAGKIGKNDWRDDIVRDLRGMDLFEDMNDQRPIEFPVKQRAIFREHDYTGPFFISCDHGCYHGNNDHGVGAGRPGYVGCYDNDFTRDERRAHVVGQCLLGIERATLVFAWITDDSCYGTLVELGYAKALRKKIVIATPEVAIPTDLWFADEVSTASITQAHCATCALAVALRRRVPHPAVRQLDAVLDALLPDSDDLPQLGTAS